MYHRMVLKPADHSNEYKTQEDFDIKGNAKLNFDIKGNAKSYPNLNLQILRA